MKPLRADHFGGDDNSYEVTWRCPPCEGTGHVPPFVMSLSPTMQDTPPQCAGCKGIGTLTRRFKTLDELRAFVAGL
jgi:hypothetical protein